MKVAFSRHIFEKYLGIKFCENLPSGSWMDMMKVVVTSHNFVNAPKKYTELILFVVLCWIKLYFMLREERGLRVFQGRVPRNVFGPQRDKITGNWTRLCHVITDLYS
jgi:hypothetical protein